MFQLYLLHKVEKILLGIGGMGWLGKVFSSDPISINLIPERVIMMSYPDIMHFYKHMVCSAQITLEGLHTFFGLPVECFYLYGDMDIHRGSVL